MSDSKFLLRVILLFTWKNMKFLHNIFWGNLSIYSIMLLNTFLSMSKLYSLNWFVRQIKRCILWDKLWKMQTNLWQKYGNLGIFFDSQMCVVVQNCELWNCCEVMIIFILHCNWTSYVILSCTFAYTLVLKRLLLRNSNQLNVWNAFET